jgi:hypothetical protein
MCCFSLLYYYLLLDPAWHAFVWLRWVLLLVLLLELFLRLTGDPGLLSISC